MTEAAGARDSDRAAVCIEAVALGQCPEGRPGARRRKIMHHFIGETERLRMGKFIPQRLHFILLFFRHRHSLYSPFTPLLSGAYPRPFPCRCTDSTIGVNNFTNEFELLNLPFSIL